MLNWLRIFFSILVLYNVIYDGFVSIRNKDYSENETSTAPKGKGTVADFIVMTFVCLTCFGFLLFIIWSKMIPAIIGVFLISVPTVLSESAEVIRTNHVIDESLLDHKVKVTKAEDYSTYKGTVTEVAELTVEGNPEMQITVQKSRNSSAQFTERMIKFLEILN